MDKFLHFAFGRYSRIRRGIFFCIMFILFLFTISYPFLLAAAYFLILLLIDFKICHHYMSKMPSDGQWSLRRTGAQMIFAEEGLSFYRDAFLRYQKTEQHRIREEGEQRQREARALRLQRQQKHERRILDLIVLAQEVVSKKVMVLLPPEMQWLCSIDELTSFLQAGDNARLTSFQTAAQRAIELSIWLQRARIVKVEVKFIKLVRKNHVQEARALVVEAESYAVALEQAKELGIRHTPNIPIGDLRALIQHFEKIKGRNRQILVWQQQIDQGDPRQRKLLTAVQAAVKGTDRQWRKAVYDLEQALEA